MVDSTTHIYLWRRGAEQTGEPSDPHETGIIGWIPLDRVAQLAEHRQLLGAGTVVALDHYLAHHAPATTTPTQPRPPRCSTWIEVPSPLREWLTTLPDSSFDLTAQTGRVQCDLDQGHEPGEPVHHTMLQQHTTGGDEWWLRWTAHGTITGIVQLPPYPATTHTSTGLCLLYRDHPGTHH